MQFNAVFDFKFLTTIMCSLLSRQDGRTLLPPLVLLECIKTKILVAGSPLICFVLFFICIYNITPPPSHLLFLVLSNGPACRHVFNPFKYLPTLTFTFVAVFVYFYCIYLAFSGNLWSLPSIHIRFALCNFAKRLTSIVFRGPLRILGHRWTRRLVNPFWRIYCINYAFRESVLKCRNVFQILISQKLAVGRVCALFQ